MPLTRPINPGPRGSLTVAERVGVAVRGTPVLYADEVIPVSLSIGVASADGVDSLTDLLHRADLGLYAAKQAGRIARAPTPATPPVTAP
jgi:diguanylate cyclase (GGDEF)-like protein